MILAYFRLNQRSRKGVCQCPEGPSASQGFPLSGTGGGGTDGHPPYTHTHCRTTPGSLRGSGLDAGNWSWSLQPLLAGEGSTRRAVADQGAHGTLPREALTGSEPGSQQQTKSGLPRPGCLPPFFLAPGNLKGWVLARVSQPFPHRNGAKVNQRHQGPKGMETVALLPVST